MTIVSYLAALAAKLFALEQEVRNMATNPGMTDVEAAKLAQLAEDVGGLKARADAMESSLNEVKAKLDAISQAQGDLSSLPPLT
jgi:hypothetical protein